MIADAAAEGLLQRHSGKKGEADQTAEAEPLAEWERELLEGKSEAPAEEATPAAEGQAAEAENTEEA